MIVGTRENMINGTGAFFKISQFYPGYDIAYVVEDTINR